MNFAIDLDGTLADWNGKDHQICGRWKKGAKAALRTLLTTPAAGDHRVVVHTCRATWEDGGGYQAVEQFLLNGGFQPLAIDEHNQHDWSPVKFVNGTTVELVVGIWVGHGKPIAHWYVDDRAIEFGGNWDTTLRALQLKTHGY